MSQSNPYVPRWTTGGPFDDTSSMSNPNARQLRDIAKVEAALKGAHPADKWFKNIQRLLKAFPQSAWVNVRFAYAALYLEDLKTAAQYFKEARALVSGPDVVFGTWFASFEAHVENESNQEDAVWSDPGNEGTIVQLWHPPQDFDAFRQERLQVAGSIITEWEALQQLLTPEVSVQRYARLLAVDSNELEEVFLLGGESLPRIVRVGFFSGAIDRVRNGPPGGPRKVIEILKDLNRGLNYLSGTVLPANAITQENIRVLHGELMASSQIGYTHIDGDEVAYLNTIGAYRRRLVTTDLTSSDAPEDEPARIVQYAKYQEIEKHMENFLTMANCRLAAVQLGRADPTAFALAAWIHYNLAIIHPFTDGNGRVIRVISSLPLLKAGFPPINIRRREKERYLSALNTAARDADLRPLANLIASEMRESITYLRSIPPPSPEDSQWRLNVDDGETRILL